MLLPCELWDFPVWWDRHHFWSCWVLCIVPSYPFGLLILQSWVVFSHAVLISTLLCAPRGPWAGLWSFLSVKLSSLWYFVLRTLAALSPWNFSSVSLTQGFSWVLPRFSLLVLHSGSSPKATTRPLWADLVYFLTLWDHCLSLSNDQSLENCCFKHFCPLF